MIWRCKQTRNVAMSNAPKKTYVTRPSPMTLYEEIGKLKNRMDLPGMRLTTQQEAVTQGLTQEKESSLAESPILTHSAMSDHMTVEVEKQSRLVGIIGEYLEKQIQIEAHKLDPSAGMLRYFEGPEIGYDITLFLERICSNSHCSPSCLVLSLVYLQRLQEGVSSPILTSKTAKRLLLVSIMVAAKYLEDRYFKNSSWAKMARISLADLNTMELELLFAIDFRLTVAHDEFSAQIVGLLRFAPRGHPCDLHPDAPRGSAPASSSHHTKNPVDSDCLHRTDRVSGAIVLVWGKSRMRGHDRLALAMDIPSPLPCGPEFSPRFLAFDTRSASASG